MANTLERPPNFAERHIGPSEDDVTEMLQELGLESMDDLVYQTIPDAIRTDRPLDLPPALAEFEALGEFATLMEQNEPRRPFLGMGYYRPVLPPVIRRNVLENPSWYTQYTPYQAEISQGRLEALFVFQTVIADLTALPITNASMLDEATAVAEAIAMCSRADRRKMASKYWVASDCHPQTIDVVRTRARPLGIEIAVAAVEDFVIDETTGGVVVQYPTTDGRIEAYHELADVVHSVGGRVIAATDLLALTLLTPPGEWGADVAAGSAQRFGVPLGFGGPHAAFLSATEDFKRHIPGRVVGQSVDRHGQPALRLALQTREQHIRREKATSNICTAQVLLAVISAFYAVYHGPTGLRRIAQRVRKLTATFAETLRSQGLELEPGARFDTVTIAAGSAASAIVERVRDAGMAIRELGDGRLGVSLDEATTPEEVAALASAFCGHAVELTPADAEPFTAALARTSEFLTHPTFHQYRSETEMLRWIHRLQSRDLSLTTSMIALGSCTMKLNATTEMIPVTWLSVADVHPYAEPQERRGYEEMLVTLEKWLAEITGMDATSLQPNAGSQGEYAGMLVIKAYHAARGDHDRDVCLIPQSAHGTNPASAVMAGLKVVVVACDDAGNVDIDDLDAKLAAYEGRVAAIMITYPSTHGVFETNTPAICERVHAAGGQVYLDGANMNAQVGLCRPGDYGADVCHLNLHKTFCIPHGGGGPGMGPICVKAHLAPFLPGHVVVATGGEQAVGAVSAAPFGSASILPIPYLYIRMLGAQGLQRATQVAILNANYMLNRLRDHYPVLYVGERGRVAHEFILDLREFKRSAGIEFFDVAKRLMDYGFHAPTMSFPVIGTMMVEPTESESRAELDRFCDALIAIRGEIDRIASGEWDREDNPLKNAPHTAVEVCGDSWEHNYSRTTAAFPAPWLREHKFWPAVARVDDAHGDRNLICTCPPVDAYR